MRRGPRRLYHRLLLRVVVVVEELQEGRKVEGKVVERDEVKEEEAKGKRRDKMGR